MSKLSLSRNTNQANLSSHKTIFRTPTASDGPAIHALIARCPPLDTNSRYCNLLQSSHFADTSVVAEQEGTLAGFISGYLVPARPDTLFVWQVAVAPESRGHALGRAMLTALLERDACRRSVQFIETSITEDNQASWHTFRGLADRYRAPLSTTSWFEGDTHFEGEHDAEHLVRIGPFCFSKDPSNQPSTHPETTP